MSGASEIKKGFLPPFFDDAAWGHRRPSNHGETPSSRPRSTTMCLRHKHCLWVGHIALIDPAERGEESSLASTVTTPDKAVTAKARTSEPRLPMIKQQAMDGLDNFEQTGPVRTNCSRRGATRTRLSMSCSVNTYPYTCGREK